VQARLGSKGFKASKNQIQEIAEHPQYKARRWNPGDRTAIKLKDRER
jgi:hypothetical protein